MTKLKSTRMKAQSKGKKNVASSNWFNLLKVYLHMFYLLKKACEWRKTERSRHLKLRIRNPFLIGKRDKSWIQANLRTIIHLLCPPPHHYHPRLQFQNMPNLALVLWITLDLDDILLSIVRWWVWALMVPSHHWRVSVWLTIMGRW